MPKQPLDIVLGMTIPGESVIVAILEYAKVARETMSQVNRDRWDALGVGMAEDWRDFWKQLVGKEKP